MAEVTRKEFEKFMRINKKIDAVIDAHGCIDMDNLDAPNAWPLSTEENTFFFEIAKKVDPDSVHIAVNHMFEDDSTLAERLAKVAARNRAH